MMRNRKSFLAVAFVSVAMLGLLWGQSEWRLRQLAQPQAHPNAAPVSPQLRAAWPAQNKRLAQLWLSRQERDVTPGLLALLKSSQHPDIRRRTVRALGRLENPQTLRSLQAWKKSLTSQEQGALSPTLPLALARIQAHNLKGQKKLDAVAKSVGLSWSEVGRLSKKVNAPKSYAQGTPGDQIVDEVVDTLYIMGKKGGDVQGLANNLTLSLPEKIILKSAGLSTAKEIQISVDYLSRLKILDGHNYKLIEHLRNLSPASAYAAMRKLSEMKKNANAYPDRVNYKALFIVATGNNDRRSLPLLKTFEQNNNSYLSQKARVMRLRVEAGEAVPVVPM